MTEEHHEWILAQHALLPEGEYKAHYDSYSLQPNFHGLGDKLVVKFSILGVDNNEEDVFGYYNVKIARKGVIYGGRSRWVTEMRHLFPEKAHGEPLPPSLLEGRIVLLKLRTVTEDSKKRKLENHQYYSVVDEILEIVD